MSYKRVTTMSGPEITAPDLNHQIPELRESAIGVGGY